MTNNQAKERMMRKHGFTDWLFTAQPRDQFTYFEGHPAPSTATIAAVRKAYDAGLIDLVQRRVSHALGLADCGEFAYIAVKRARVARIAEQCRFADVPDIARRM